MYTHVSSDREKHDAHVVSERRETNPYDRTFA